MLAAMKPRASLVAENLALRQQLAALNQVIRDRMASTGKSSMPALTTSE
jgi:hypothetical protein